MTPTGSPRKTPRRSWPLRKIGPSSTDTREADIQGIRESTSNPIETLPADVRDYPDAVAHALSQLRLVGVNGPYSVLLGPANIRRSPKPAITDIPCSNT